MPKLSILKDGTRKLEFTLEEKKLPNTRLAFVAWSGLDNLKILAILYLREKYPEIDTFDFIDPQKNGIVQTRK